MKAQSIPRPEYPRPQFVRPDWFSLNGTWEFEMDPGRSGREREVWKKDKLSEKIVVPFCPESELSGINNKDFMPAVWYRRKFNIPQNWNGKRITLHFGAVDYYAQVWVNGQQVGSHRGGYTPFVCEITSNVQVGENVIVVYAEDDTRSPLQPCGKQSSSYHSHDCVYTRTTGIWQTVWMEAVPQTYIESVKMIPDLSNGQLFIEAKVNGKAKGLNFLAEAEIDGKTVGSAKSICQGRKVYAVIFPSEVRAWSLDDPFLYDLQLCLEDGNGVVDSVSSYFGLRSIEIDGPAVLLNGKPVFMRLVLDQGFYPDGIYTAESDSALKNDVEISLGLGFNGARLHEKVFEPRFLYWADKLGYLVWGEFPNWGIDHSRHDVVARYLEEWIEAVERDFNHPSIIGWCPFNETPHNQNPELLRTIYRTTKRIDPIRHVLDTSGYVHVETDLYDVHDYDQNPESFAERHRPLAEGGKACQNVPGVNAPYQGQPYWVSEYGGIWWNPGQKDDVSWGYGGRPKSEEEFLQRYRKLTEILLSHPRMCGFCYTQLYDIEQEVNGLYTYDRRTKFNPELIRAINQQKAAVEK